MPEDSSVASPYDAMKAAKAPPAGPVPTMRYGTSIMERPLLELSISISPIVAKCMSELSDDVTETYWSGTKEVDLV